MAHHGQDPFREKFGVFKKLQDGLRDVETHHKRMLGDTGQYPQGALTEDDEGEIRFAVSVKSGKVVLDFGKPVAWIGFDADQAVELAQLLVKRAADAKGVPMTLRIGQED